MDVPGAWMVLDYGAVEAEYASLRRGAGLVEWAQWGIVEVSGADATALLDRLTTNALAPVAVGGWVATFLTNRKGRIEADIIAVRTGTSWLLQLDVACVPQLLSRLEQVHFGEDVAFRERSDRVSLGVHGPRAAALLAEHAEVFGAEDVKLDRPWLGSPGVELIVGSSTACALWDACVSAEPSGVRAVGWSAANIARLEAGAPLFAIDFATENLPAETGMLDTRVSFTKGCYPGQEVVARMKHLGAPKQVLVGLRGRTNVPQAGDEVREVGAAAEAPGIGAVTSSALSPMRGGEPIAFAMVKTSKARDGAVVEVMTEEGRESMTIGPLCSLPGGAAC